MTEDPPPFDVCGPLPEPGITVLEASAGTGKTFTITSLVTRYVAHGVPLEAILAVTFTRMATGELRDRVRRRLVAAHALLARHLGGIPIGPAEDEVVARLADAPRAEVEGRVRRLADAVASFDSATIATTHGFCQLVLDGLGTAGEVAGDATLLEDPADLVDQVVDDLYLRWALQRGKPGFERNEARAAVMEAVRNPGVALAPEPAPDGPGLLRRLVERAAAEVTRRLQDHALLTYDQLLARLAATLGDPQRGPLACSRLRRRYRVVLVDEFQDTDPVQWQVMDRAFGDGSTTLVLVGDPKQAIYSFRGADVHAYLDAAAKARRYTLGQNWRSDQPLLDATHALLYPLHMGHEQIRFRSVDAPPDRSGPGFSGFPVAAPIRLRLVSNHRPDIQRTPSHGLLQKGALVEWIAGDVARDVARLLGSGATIGDRPVRPADIAVLTRTNRQSVEVRDAFRRARIPAVVAGLDSVFASASADHWLRLLEALEEPASRSRAVALALTPFVGMSAVEVATAGERVWEAVHARAHRWSAILAGFGVAALYKSITATEGLPARLVAVLGGERDLTDLGHVAELLHAEAAGGQMGVAALRAWLARRMRQIETDDAGAEERTRRLDSDAEAVQVLTVHRAKGLEFGVVYCPFLWDAAMGGDGGGPVIFHDPDHGDARTLDVGCRDRDGLARKRYDEHGRLARAEERGEELRLMYVALTRARHQVVLWWGRADKCRHSPLGRLLMCRDLTTGEVREAFASEPSDDQIKQALGRLLARTDLIAAEVAGDAGGPTLTAGPGPAPVSLEVARFERTLDLRWRRASYSSITAAAFDAWGKSVGSEPEQPLLNDEPPAQVGPAAATAPAPETTVTSPWSELPVGAEFGTYVHGVLERLDFESPDFASAMPAGAVPPGADPEQLAAAIGAALSTPLGPLLPGTTLGHIARADRADEMRFELPLAGGDQPAGQVSTSDIARLLERDWPTTGPLAGYPARLLDPLLATELRGYLTGSLDLVFRRPDGQGTTRWYVADYKTNWLGDGGSGLTAWDYRSDALDAEMQRHHYPLQALLYLVALHRYLRWRLPGYQPDLHLGGVLYLFLRGMIGADAPLTGGQPAGVFSWAPPAQLVVDLSDLFGTGP